MTLTQKEKTVLRKVKKMTREALQKQTRDGLSKIFTELSCKGIAREIKAGRNVSGNAAFGIRMCVHNKIGPRVNVKTMKFSPMTKRAKQIEKGFVDKVNFLLKNADYSPMPSDLISRMRKKDADFKKEVAKRRKQLSK